MKMYLHTSNLILMDHKELLSLKEWQMKYMCNVRGTGTICSNLIQVDFVFNGIHYNLYVDDEYNDFNEENQLLCLYLVLRSLKDYKEEDDFLKWCNLYSLNASDSNWLNYYRSLDFIAQAIENEASEIKIFITDLDYQLRSGAFYELVNLQQ